MRGFGDYANWFNKLRIHGTPRYVTPIEYKRSP
ncbi:IS3 family transposase [Priestia endophytica]